LTREWIPIDVFFFMGSTRAHHCTRVSQDFEKKKGENWNVDV
jgi:hypothetical protein